MKQDELALHEAALHLMVLHLGDGAKSLVMPPACNLASKSREPGLLHHRSNTRHSRLPISL
ncbi:hypothetical protein B7H18_00035 [Pseudomonas putida]|nr:hypothetical protein B7H18_00035 [Pseudomonas putida]